MFLGLFFVVKFGVLLSILNRSYSFGLTTKLLTAMNCQSVITPSYSLILLFSGLLFFACSSGQSDGFVLVKKGMHASQVIDILGEPEEKVDLGSVISMWHYPENQTVQLIGGQVDTVIADHQQLDGIIKAEKALRN